MNTTTNGTTRHMVNGKVITEVTRPIQAHDLNTPRVIEISPRKWLVTNANADQRAELQKMGGRYEPMQGVTFRASRENRDRLHIWQNEQARKERARILGEGWQYSGDLNDGTPHAKPGDEICCIDGTTGTCSKASPEIVCIEFKSDRDGRALTVAGYFFRTPFDWQKYHEERRRALKT